VITAVCLNPAVDKTYRVFSLQPGRIHRVERVEACPGGKGINVAKVLKRLGLDIRVTGFIGGGAGDALLRGLDRWDIPHRMVRIPGETRTCLNILEEVRRTQTEFLEPGPAVPPKKWEALKETVAEMAEKSRVVVLSGSLPPGLAADAYYELISLVQSRRAKAIVDTGGAPLARALESRPFTVKPNGAEMASLFQREEMSDSERIGVLREWNRGGIPLACVTLGERGAIASMEGRVYRVIPPKIEAVNPVGSGDAFAAGLAAGLDRGEGIESALALAAASAASNALHLQAGQVNAEQVASLKRKVHVAILSP
jgi:tagatose 6-phosphate kinase